MYFKTNYLNQEASFSQEVVKFVRVCVCRWSTNFWNFKFDLNCPPLLQSVQSVYGRVKSISLGLKKKTEGRKGILVREEEKKKNQRVQRKKPSSVSSDSNPLCLHITVGLGVRKKGNLNYYVHYYYYYSKSGWTEEKLGWKLSHTETISFLFFCYLSDLHGRMGLGGG